MINRSKIFSLAIGLLAAAGLFLFYSLTMRLLAGSWAAAWWQFRELWYLMTPLIAGFGVQIGLFSYIKFLSSGPAPSARSTSRVRIEPKRRVVSANGVAASSATSTVSMIACCAHHATDFIPILGLSALSLWLVNFQKPLLILGILSNLAGSLYLWKKLSKMEVRYS